MTRAAILLSLLAGAALGGTPYKVNPNVGEGCKNDPQVLYIILETKSEAVSSYEYGPETEGLTDEWISQKQDGDVSYPARFHQKAILFTTDEALTGYLSKHDCNGQLFFDIVRGKQYRICPLEHKKTRVDTTRILDYYEPFMIDTRRDARR